ncbi:GNAT family N-acetyltransferase [Geodermatophilus amargosae]|uniref:GNAT family N-acetyltransferase n=1 Tax=Geodermatophilus amargosae TaxID=1296565 RepID=UPI0034E017BB
MTGTGLRPLLPSDGLLLRVATWLDVNWCGDRISFAGVDADPQLAEYCRIDPAAGDFGLVSTAGSLPTGVVWVRSFPAERPGYGSVAAGVPELSVCVLPGYRGAGTGGTLLRAAIAEARRRSIAALSLSVEDGNPSRRLYERLGFTPVPSAPHPGTMLLRLAGRDEPARGGPAG